MRRLWAVLARIDHFFAFAELMCRIFGVFDSGTAPIIPHFLYHNFLFRFYYPVLSHCMITKEWFGSLVGGFL